VSYNGSGTFNITTAGQPVVTGTVISSTAFNALTADLATGLSTAITKDGQTTTTARILFAQGISSTLVTDATSATTGSIITAGGISTQKALFTGGNITASAAGAIQIIAQSTVNSTYPTMYLKANNRSWWTSALDTGTDASLAFGIGAVPGTNELMRLTPAGLLGIGMTPTSGVGTVQAIADASLYAFTGYRSGFNVGQGFYSNVIALQNASSTMVPYAAIGGNIATSTAGSHTGNLIFAVAQAGALAEVGRFDASGNLHVGYPSALDRNVIYKAVAEGTINFQVFDANQGSAIFLGCSNGAYNSANAAIWVSKNSATTRSINAGGTINASGADYAEYMAKADGCGVISKGAVVGVNADGKLTDKFAEAHSFVIKSTDPSYVGGDTWGSDDAIGKHPVIDGKDKDETDEEHQVRIKDFEAALEKARAKVDRIAFSGQVPVNVTGATVGDYIVPVAGPDGGIAGKAVTNPTFDQYRAAVGRVWKILEDGRAFVSVKVS